MEIHGSKKILSEVKKELEANNISFSSPSLSLNPEYINVLSVAIGASIPIVGQVLLGIINKKNGQRKFILEIEENSKRIKIELESPTEEDFQKLLQKATKVSIEGFSSLDS